MKNNHLLKGIYAFLFAFILIPLLSVKGYASPDGSTGDYSLIVNITGGWYDTTYYETHMATHFDAGETVDMNNYTINYNTGVIFDHYVIEPDGLTIGADGTFIMPSSDVRIEYVGKYKDGLKLYTTYNGENKTDFLKAGSSFQRVGISDNQNLSTSIRAFDENSIMYYDYIEDKYKDLGSGWGTSMYEVCFEKGHKYFVTFTISPYILYDEVYLNDQKQTILDTNPYEVFETGCYKNGNDLRFCFVLDTGQINVSFDSNGGDGTKDAISIYAGNALPTDYDGITAPGGKKFRGWSLTTNGEVITDTSGFNDDVTVYAIWEDKPVQVAISDSINNGRVFSDRFGAELDEEIYIAALPEPGYILDYYTINGQKLIANHFNYSTPGDVEVGAVFVKSNMTLNDYDKFKIDNVADSLNLDREKLEGFIKSLPKIYSLTDDECNIKDLYLNQTKLLLDFIRPVYTKLYSLPYENGEYTPDAPDSMIDYATCLGDDEMGCVLTDEEYAEYIKEITGYLILSYISVYNKAHEGNVTVLQNIYDVTFDDEFDPYNSLHVLNTMCYINNLILDTFYEHYANFLEASYKDLQSWHGTISEYDEFNECLERTASLNYIGTIDSDYDMGDFDDYTRYSIYVEEFIDCMLRMDFSDDDLMRLNIEIAKEAEESYNEWVNSNLTFDEVFDLQNRKLKYIDDEIAKLQDLLEQESLAEEYTQEIDDIRIELAKKEVRILVKVLCDLTVLSESEFAEGTSNDLQSLMVYDHDDIAEIMTKILGISSYPKSVIAIHSQHVLNDFANKGLYNNKDYAHEIINTYIELSNKEEIKAHFNSLKNKIKSDITPRTSSSKTYKANDTKDTAEKISGSGKKGSKRTITPIEGKKVSSVIVTDKDGNKVDVTLNEDGTYSFVQPASNVDVQINYKNREITLNIGSTEASVDGETSNLDVAPILRNDRTMLPIRFVAENLGAKVDWDEKNPDKVIISRRDIKIEITLGSDIALVNGKKFKLDSVAFAENDRTYLPVRFVSEALNAIVEWNESKPNEVKIYEQ